MFPPPQEAPIKNRACRDDSNLQMKEWIQLLDGKDNCSMKFTYWAQIRSMSNSSSAGAGIDEACKGILSQGAPVKVAKPSIARPDTKAS